MLGAGSLDLGREASSLLQELGRGRGREARPLKGAVSSGFIDTIELSLRSRQNNLLSVCKGTAFRSLRPTGVNPKGDKIGTVF